MFSFVSQTARPDLCQGPCHEGWVYLNKRCFQYVPEKTNWLDAEKHCLLLGGNLASEHTEDEHRFLKELAGHSDPQNGAFWIGLSDQYEEGTWIWSDGTRAISEGDFLRWNSGEPNNSGNENCVHSNFGGESNWNDIACDGQYPSICALRFNY
ncbi:hypothetical protein SKAU_G00382940 [Synaphobranchus kaupii]|uniref:C-type lectin domain-containing protein n=1 Tax=Synaphobranchus kaupii TaxID=118154 RepID=A0A9Q1EDZ6_SYNKA|nr:hypothetical protein SKAU_G00382940 [Synaphobranchus kaupii]